LIENTSQWFKRELLSPDGSLSHEATFSMNKDGHAFMIFGFCLDAGLGASTGAGTFPGGSGLGLGPGCYGDCLSGSAKLEITTCEFIVGPFVLKENNLATRSLHITFTSAISQ
jgi:hypothetical protein